MVLDGVFGFDKFWNIFKIGGKGYLGVICNNYIWNKYFFFYVIFCFYCYLFCKGVVSGVEVFFFGNVKVKEGLVDGNIFKYVEVRKFNFWV